MYLYICGHISRAQPAQAHADHSDPVTLFSFCLNVITGALAVSVRLTGPIECCCRSASFLVWCFLVSVWRREPFVYGINIRWIMRATQWIWNSCCYIRRKREKRILWITPFDCWVELMGLRRMASFLPPPLHPFLFLQVDYLHHLLHELFSIVRIQESNINNSIANKYKSNIKLEM